MKIKSQKDFFAGLMFTVVGVAFSVGATTYTVGSGARMGPGYFPLMLGILMAILGLAIGFKALTVETADGDKIGKWAWKPLVCIIAANLVFGVLLAGLPSIGFPAFGLIVAIYALIFIACLADNRKFNFKETLILATVLAVGSYVAFVWALKLQFPVWPSFITG
ncbi:tripartite tricarboxylate transporter TctB family protein [Ramlibacter sp. H39-3-26]|uniref:tripartite tricarboxylate transporter TctB family protein n=1 Tax=Curvibacter soli TaxID=3031331 RepID=UPI0023DCA65D|nr:tripartite tricarboxylate transporter TctB family protein [Ramlibacter sp. H39-3-26]MDF1483621.1 tripartite tricarboxylate transporter TctB family protein [Ramlibacter sp. H39-3-26]